MPIQPFNAAVERAITLDSLILRTPIFFFQWGTKNTSVCCVGTCRTQVLCENRTLYFQLPLPLGLGFCSMTHDIGVFLSITGPRNRLGTNELVC